MNNKEFKSYKKELKSQSPYKKLSSAITAADYQINKKGDTLSAIHGFRKKRGEVAHKMKKMKNKHEDALYTKSTGRAIRHDYMGHDED